MNFKAGFAALVVVLVGLYATPVVAEEGQGTQVERIQDRKHDGKRDGKHGKRDGKHGKDGKRDGKRKGYRPPAGAHFNVPIGGKAAQTRIEDVVRGAINHAKKGSYIRIALFSFDRHNMADALIKAHKRGVHVQVLLNDHQITRAMRKMNRAFGHSLKRKSWMRQCNSGCRSRGEFLHSKMYLFSKTGRATNVSMTGSVNLTTNALIHQWNDLYVVNGHQKTYDKFLKTFEEMKRDKPIKRPHRVYNIKPRYQLQVFPVMNADKKSDPMMGILNKVKCKGARGGAGINGRTMIRVNMHRWADRRGGYLADKIVNLWAAGCNVRVMHGSADDTVRARITRSTKRGRVPIRSNGFDDSGDGMIDRYTHTKYVIISGHYGNSRSERRIITGSSNWSGRGLSGDELQFRVRGPKAVQQYKKNFDYIWNNGSRAIPYGRAKMAMMEPEIGGPAWEND
jgi:phosphatidylserine/phosphatidylglycerophosphate/cardiolipin synthase-like enzyme